MTKAGQSQLATSLVTVSDAGREPWLKHDPQRLYLHIAKVGFFLLDQRLTSVFWKDLDSEYVRLWGITQSVETTQLYCCRVKVALNST